MEFFFDRLIQYFKFSFCLEKGKNSTIELRTSIFVHTYIDALRKTNSEHLINNKNIFIFPHCFILLNAVIGVYAVIKGCNVVTLMFQKTLYLVYSHRNL